MRAPVSIERRKLFEQVAAHIQRQILEGYLQPGEQLPPERELQDIFGVGRPAIREALIALERANLVELTNGARARVAMPSPRMVIAATTPAVQFLLSTREGQEACWQARKFFEVGLARDAARNASREDLLRLEDALAANEQCLGDPERFAQSDVEFHRILADRVGNPVFSGLHDAFVEWLRAVRRQTLIVPGSDRMGYEAHVRIYEGIRSGSADLAEAAMADHLDQGRDLFWKTLESGESGLVLSGFKPIGEHVS